MIAKLFEVRETGNRGKGLFAKKLIPRGTIICFECDACRIMTAEEIGYDEMSEDEKFALLDYAYRKEDGSFVVPCDETRYLNHSCDANILGTDRGFDIVVGDIEKGEEATYDYRDFHDGVVMTCRCGADNCCGVVDFAHPIPDELRAFWNERVNAALTLVDEVDQPLRKELENINRW